MVWLSATEARPTDAIQGEDQSGRKRASGSDGQERDIVDLIGCRRFCVLDGLDVACSWRRGDCLDRLIEGFVFLRVLPVLVR